jgi:glycosyltransferase involved in cell wall biosynthesis
MTARPKTLIVIPAFNEADSIAYVIGQIREHVPWADIAVVNDGSHDRTGAIAEACGVIVLNMPYNVGIGAAVQTGFLYAARHGYDVAVQTDGDGQHPPSEIPTLLAALAEGDADMVLGSRFIEDKGYRTPAARRAGIVLLARIISLATGERCTDPTSGFRASNRRTIRLCARDYPHDYPEPEAIVMLRRAGLRIREVPVKMSARYGGRSSITPLRSGYYMVKVILAIFISLVRQPPVVDRTED